MSDDLSYDLSHFLLQAGLLLGFSSSNPAAAVRVVAVAVCRYYVVGVDLFRYVVRGAFLLDRKIVRSSSLDTAGQLRVLVRGIRCRARPVTSLGRLRH